MLNAYTVYQLRQKDMEDNKVDQNPHSYTGIKTRLHTCQQLNLTTQISLALFWRYVFIKVINNDNRLHFFVDKPSDADTQAIYGWLTKRTWLIHSILTGS